MRRWMTCLLVLAMAGTVSAIRWEPAFSPPTVGYWEDALSWNTNLLPGPDEKTQFSNTWPAECIVTSEVYCGQLVIGDGGAGGPNVLRITDGAILNAKTNGGSWAAVSYNREAHCIVEAGGQFNINTRLGVGLVGEGDGFLEVYGDVTMTGAFQVAPVNPGNGKVVIYHGGTVTAAYPEMGDPGKALIDIWGDGVLTYDLERTNQINGFIADGRIIGNRLTNNVNVEVVVNAGVTNTVITAKDTFPNLDGLPFAEATNVVAAFGYTVGTVTYDFVAGALTDHVIGQTPAAGAPAGTNGDPVDIVLQALSIPDLIGMDFTVASNALVNMGLGVGTVTTNYVFDATPEVVLDQDPLSGGLASPGQLIDLTIMEPLATNPEGGDITVDALGTGNWMDPAVWGGNSNNIPIRETQGFKVRNFGGYTLTLTNKVAVKYLVLGDGGPGYLDILDGGHFVGGQFGNWNAVGYSADATVNVYAGGIFECRKNLLYALNGGNCAINVDGGTVEIGDWISLGNAANFSSTTTTITNGGSFICLRFRDQDVNTNGVIIVADGTFAMHGTGRINDIQWGLDNGIIQIADGYSYTLSNESGDSVLTGFKPGYGAWADTWLPAVIGSETDDFDMDGADNFYEYVLNGDPTNAAVQGVAPTFVDVGGASFQYTHVVRNDDPNLVYTVKTTTDLMTPWGDGGSFILGTNETGTAYDEVINSVPVVEDTTFVKLEVVNTNAP